MTRDSVVAPLVEMSRVGRLYPAIILHGGSGDGRREAATTLSRALLCEREEEARPCGECPHCRRISVEQDSETFHPDLHRLERDQKTVTSVEAARQFLQAAQMAPFEARGQVFVVAAAETLGPEAADTLLKMLEEPPPRTPRHFFLLTPSNSELSPTLRSRSMSVFLGAGPGLDGEGRAEIAEAFGASLSRYVEAGSSVDLLAAAAALQRAGGWNDLRAGSPWSLAAAAVVDSASDDRFGAPVRRALLALAGEILDGRSARVRGITPQRILEGLVVHHLAGVADRVAAP